MINLKSNIEKNILGIEDANKPIYRIFPRARFLELVKTRKNTLVRPRMWDDPFENFFLKCTAETDSGEDVSLEVLREKWYGQCWTTEEDTDSMWRIYSHNKDGIRVKTTPRKLLSSLWATSQENERQISCLIGKVKYLSKNEIESFLENSVAEHILINPEKTAGTLLMKRGEFRHEQEVRILFQDIRSSNSKSIFQHAVNFNEIIDEVAIDPRSTSDELQMLARHLQENGLTPPVVQSSLYGFSPKKIKLSLNP